MLRLIGAAVLALTAASPAFAQGRDNDDRGKGSDKERGADKGNARADRAERDDDGDDRGRARLPRGFEEARRALPNREARAWRDDDREDTDSDRDLSRDDDRDDRRDWSERERIYASVPGCPPGLARKNNGCLPPGIARQQRDDDFGYAYRPALFGIPLRAAADYVLYDGYLIPSGGGSGGVARYLPLLGGALSVGQLWPEAYPSLPLSDWQRDYFGFEDPDAYRYADNVVYQVDPATSAIEAVAALLTGSDFAVGQPLPQGYDVYNVPDPYQDRYADSDEAMYRYADGRVYEVDPVSMLVEQIIDLVA